MEGNNLDKLITAQLEVSEKRTALAALLDAEASDVDAIETAKNEVTASEKRHQAVMVADGGNKTVEITTGTPETRELLDLEKRANVGELFDSVLSHGQPIGAMAELQQHLGLQGNQVPLALISRFSNREERAVTPAPANVTPETRNATHSLTCSRKARPHSWAWKCLPWALVMPSTSVLSSDPWPWERQPKTRSKTETTGGFFGLGVDAKPDSSGLFLQPGGPGAVCWHGFGLTGEPERRPCRWP